MLCSLYRSDETEYLIGTIDILVHLGSSLLDTVQSYNYLGITIDCYLNFVKFLQGKWCKVNTRIFQLSKMHKFMTHPLALLIYKETILPIMDYADFMEDSGPSDSIAKLHKLQFKALKIINNGEFPNVKNEQLEQRFKILFLPERRTEHIACIMHRMSKLGQLLDHVRPVIHPRSRNKIKFKATRRRYESSLKSPMSRGISVWNRLHEKVQKTTTKVKFKSELRAYLPGLTLRSEAIYIRADSYVVIMIYHYTSSLHCFICILY